MDCLNVQGIRGYGYTGALPEEKILGQWFEVDLQICLDLAQAGQTDTLSNTLDYRNIITEVQDIVRRSHFNLVERLATVIAESVLNHPEVSQVKVLLTKVAPPIPDFPGQIQVEIIRSKAV